MLVLFTCDCCVDGIYMVIVVLMVLTGDCYVDGDCRFDSIYLWLLCW